MKLYIISQICIIQIYALIRLFKQTCIRGPRETCTRVEVKTYVSCQNLRVVANISVSEILTYLHDKTYLDNISKHTQLLYYNFIIFPYVIQKFKKKQYYTSMYCICMHVMATESCHICKHVDMLSKTTFLALLHSFRFAEYLNVYILDW